MSSTGQCTGRYLLKTRLGSVLSILSRRGRFLNATRTAMSKALIERVAFRALAADPKLRFHYQEVRAYYS